MAIPPNTDNGTQCRLTQLFALLPDENRRQLFDSLDGHDTVCLLATCRFFYRWLSSDQAVWRRLYLATYPLHYSNKEASFLVWCVDTDPQERLALADPDDAYSLRNWRELLRRRATTRINWLRGSMQSLNLRTPGSAAYLQACANLDIGYDLLLKERTEQDTRQQVLILEASADDPASPRWRLRALPSAAHSSGLHCYSKIAQVSRRFMAVTTVIRDVLEHGIRVFDRRTLQFTHEDIRPGLGTYACHGRWLLEHRHHFSAEDTNWHWCVWQFDRWMRSPRTAIRQGSRVVMCYAGQEVAHIYTLGDLRYGGPYTWQLDRVTPPAAPVRIGSGQLDIHADELTSATETLVALDNVRALADHRMVITTIWESSNSGQRRKRALVHSLKLEKQAGTLECADTVELFPPHEKLILLPRGFLRVDGAQVVCHPSGRLCDARQYPRPWPVNATITHLIDEVLLVSHLANTRIIVQLVDGLTGRVLRTLGPEAPVLSGTYCMTMSSEYLDPVFTVWDYGAY